MLLELLRHWGPLVIAVAFVLWIRRRFALWAGIVCCSRAYYCPTAKTTECQRHGGFAVCCDEPDKHITLKGDH